MNRQRLEKKTSGGTKHIFFPQNQVREEDKKEPGKVLQQGLWEVSEAASS